jgi:N-acetylglucosaminyl-diphospho-decaprenol L-rhamnosyltransferase
MPKFKHFIFSLFNPDNIMLPTWKPEAQRKLKRLQFDEDWMQERCRLMETYTIPSIQSQTNQDFTWVLLVHSKTPKHIMDKLDSYPCEVWWTETDYEGVKDRLSEEEWEDDEWVLTTNLDTDDAINREFVNEIQEEFRGVRECVSFTEGMAYRVTTGNSFKSHIMNNAYQTAIELGKDAEGILVIDHLRLAEVFDVRYVYTEDPMWFQVVHGGNISNLCIKKHKLAEEYRRDYVQKFFEVEVPE